MSIRIAIGALVASLVTTLSPAQYYYIPFIVPSNPAADLSGSGLKFTVGDGSIFVGATGLSFKGVDAGVYEFDRNTYQFIKAFNPVSEPQESGFGFHLEYLNGDLFVSAPFAITPFSQSGGELYRINANTTAVQHTYYEFGGFANFGWNFEANGAITVVGAHGNDKLYVYSAVTEDLILTFEPDPMTLDTDYGYDVELNTSYLAVSAPNTFFNDREGAVYVYDYITGVLLHRLTSPIDDPGVGTADFGHSIELVGDKLLVGYTNFGAANVFRDKIHVFDLTTGNLITTLTTDTGALDDGFGDTISSEGNIAVIGARLDDTVATNSGAVYIYNMDTLELIQKVLPVTGNSEGLGFGRSVHIQDGVILASGSNNATPEFNDSRFYILERFCRPDINLDGNLNFLDVSAFLKFAIDYNEDASFNFLDISAFLAAFSAGCP
ncbi:MAG: FG-GAP repeat protein [Phycisphaerales bacterium]